MILIMRPRLPGANIPAAVPTVGLRFPGTASKQRRLKRALMSALRRATLLVALALLVLTFLAARGSLVGP
jgi:hypothetical protein